MANVNITPVTLIDIELIRNGERLNETNLNRPIIQLRDNQIAQNTMLDDLYGAFSSDNVNFDTFQELLDEVTSLGESISGFSLNGDDVGIVGDLSVGGDLLVDGDIYSAGQIMASQAWVALNGGGGGGTAGGGVEITRVIELIGDGTNKVFTFDFISESVSILIEGVMVPRSDYSFNYTPATSDGISITMDYAPTDGDIVTCISYGGADVYTKDQVDTLFGAAALLAKLKTVDGVGSGLDADLLQGQTLAQVIAAGGSGAVDFNGGEVTNPITITSNTTGQLVLNKTSSTQYSGINWSINNAEEWLNYTVNDGSNDMIMRSNGSTYSYKIYNSTGVVQFYSDPTVGGDKIWHAGNDGAGSGLDADKLDGYSSTSYLRSDAYDVKTSGNLTLNDNIILNFGSGGDMEMFHNGSNMYSDLNGGGIWILRDGNSGNVNRFLFDIDNGNFSAYGNVTAYYSDIRLKAKTGSIENPLDKINAIDTFYYTNNELANSFGYTSTESQVGVSAQSVEAVMPECVKPAPFDIDINEETGEKTSKSGEDYLTVDYANLVPLLLEGIKELEARIKILEGK